MIQYLANKNIKISKNKIKKNVKLIFMETKENLTIPNLPFDLMLNDPIIKKY